MDKQNILPIGEYQGGQCTALSDLNQLYQKPSNSNEIQNEKNQNQLNKQQEEEENEEILFKCDKTLKRKVKSQILRDFGKNSLFQISVCQVINKEEVQYVVLSMQFQDNQNYLKYQTLRQETSQANNNCKRIDLQQKQHEQTANIQQILSQKELSIQKDEQNNNRHSYQQEILEHNETENILQNIETYLKKMDQSNNQYQTCDGQIISQQPFEIEQQGKQNLKNTPQQNLPNNKCYIIFLEPNENEKQEQNNLHYEEVTQQIDNQYNQQGLQNEKTSDNIIQQEEILNNHQKNQVQEKESQIGEKQIQQEEVYLQIMKQQNDNQTNKDESQPAFNYLNQQIIGNSLDSQQVEIERMIEKQKNLTKLYLTQIESIFNKIEEYDFQEHFDYLKQSQEQIYDEQWDQNTFDKCNMVQSDFFKAKKLKIFENLMEKQLYLCKIVVQNEKEDLILGFYQKEVSQQFTDQDGEIQVIKCKVQITKQEDFNKYIFKILYNPSILKVDSLNQILETLGIKFEQIQIEQEDILIYVIIKEDFLQIQKKFEQLIQFNQKIQQTGEYLEINSNSFYICKKCENQKTCQSINCFKNVKSHVISFLKYKNLKYHIFQYKLIDGIAFQFNQEQFAVEYLNFLYKTVFNFLKNDQDQEEYSDFGQRSQFECDSQQQEITEKTSNFNELNDIDQVVDYKFIDYQVYDIQDLSEKIFNGSIKRQWNINIFNDVNQNQVSDTFLKYQNDIIKILKTKNYFLCKLFIVNKQEDIFIGYQELDGKQMKYQDYIFVIKYNPNDEEIQKYLLMQRFHEEVNHFIINDFIHIFILQQDPYLEIFFYFEEISSVKFEWKKEDFEQTNKNKIINNQACNKCKECQQKKECPDYYEFKQFQVQKEMIFECLVKKNYFICEYLTRGGEGILFSGYMQKDHQKIEVVFKILFDRESNDLQDEINIMKLFEDYVCVIKFIDFIKINDNVHVIVLEKCKFSLKDELQQIQKDKDFPLDKLLQMIFNLIDGLIQLRIYNILHLDIKPQNILLTEKDEYIYTDFGISAIKKESNLQVNAKGYTKFYASPEQLQDEKDIDFQSDVYSLGKTFEVILLIFQEIQQQNYQEITFNFQQIVKQKMLQKQSQKRSNCLELSKEFFQIILKHNECFPFLQKYIKQMKTILQSHPYDENKEIPYFLEIVIYYNKNILDIQKLLLKENLNFKQSIEQQQEDIATQTNKVGQCYGDVKDISSALVYFHESLKMRKQIYLENHRYVAISLYNISFCYSNANYLKKSLICCLESILMVKQIFQENKQLYAYILDYLGTIYSKFNQNEKSLKYYFQALNMKRQILIQNHPEISYSLKNIGYNYSGLNNHEKALEYFIESLIIEKNIHKNIHPDVSQSLYNVGTSYKSLKNYKKALGYLLESLKMHRLIYKNDGFFIADCLIDIGICYMYFGDYQKSLENFSESIQIQKKSIKRNSIAPSLIHIGICYSKLGDNQKGLKNSLDALQMLDQKHENNFPYIQLCLCNIASIYQQWGDKEVALEYLLESLQIQQKICKQNLPQIARFMEQVGDFYFYFNESKKALLYLLKSLEMKKQSSKENHTSIAQLHFKISACYKNLEDIKIAYQYAHEYKLTQK